MKKIFILVAIISVMMYYVPNILEIIIYLYNIFYSIFIKNRKIADTIICLMLIYNFLKLLFLKQKILYYNYGLIYTQEDDAIQDSLTVMVLLILGILYVFTNIDFLIIYIYIYFTITFIVFDYIEIEVYINRKKLHKREQKKNEWDN